jgi:hypothetical protein
MKTLTEKQAFKILQLQGDCSGCYVSKHGSMYEEDGNFFNAKKLISIAKRIMRDAKADNGEVDITIKEINKILK